MKQGEIWLINLDPTVGAEIKKTRPAIVINNNSLGKLPLRIIVPLTDWKEKYAQAPWMIKIQPDSVNGLSKVSSADCFQIRSISNNRFLRKIGVVSDSVLASITIGLDRVLSQDSSGERRS